MSSYTAPVVTSPISTELPPTLAFLSNPISHYLNAAPPYNNVTLGALLFSPPPHVPRLLLLQKGAYFGLALYLISTTTQSQDDFGKPEAFPFSYNIYRPHFYSKERTLTLNP